MMRLQLWLRKSMFYGLRLLWLLLALLTVGVHANGARYAWEKAVDADVAGLLQALGMPAQPALLISISLEMLSGLACVVLALLLFLRVVRPSSTHDPMTLYTAYMLLSFSLVLNGNVSSIPVEDVFWDNTMSLIGFLGAMLFVLFMLIFPDGRYVPRLAVWLPRLFILWFISWFFFPQYGPANSPTWITNLVVAGWMLVALAMQIYRFNRVATPLERQQMKWVAYPLTILLTVEVLATLLDIFIPTAMEAQSSPLIELPLYIFGDLLWLLFPIGLVMAILRYRLWEIDRLINKTLVYALLTLILVAVYFGSVMLLQNLFVAYSGQSSNAAVVISTLGVAVLFKPLRDRLQAGIDRRFYRRRYDAERILENFGDLARTEVSLERLAGQLTDVVDQTLDPEVLSLWLVSTGPTSRRDERAWKMLLELDQ